MEEDNEELLQYTDDESLSETEDQCCPVEKPEDRFLCPLTFFPHSKLDFFISLTFLILSSITLLIIIPLYINTLNVRGNIYSLIVFNVPLSTVVLSIIVISMKMLWNKFKSREILSLPIKFWKLFQLAVLYIGSGYLYFYGSDRNRVLCHLQDPMKGIALVFALLYYFFFCKKLMGLHRIFATTTVIVGLFIAVDYGLCDEFVCRGYDRQQVSDDAGPWSWKTHSIWTGLYILSLTLFAAFFTLLDGYLSPEYDMVASNVIATSFLNTISRSITGSTSNDEAASQEQRRQGYDELGAKKSPLRFALWIHILASVLVVSTFWIDFIPGVGKGDTVLESLNFTMHGLLCHFTNQDHAAQNSGGCGHVFWYAAVFQIAYIAFVISSIRFLMLSQSAVFTIAVTSFALPIIGIWWSLFYASPTGSLIWSPKIRGEFVCSVIGLPIISIGLGLLCKAHFEDIHKPRTVMARQIHS